MSALLIVDNLPNDFPDEGLAEIFRPFGSVISSRLVRDTQGQFLGFGFVEMETVDPSQVVSELSGKDIQGKTITVSVVKPSAPP